MIGHKNVVRKRIATYLFSNRCKCVLRSKAIIFLLLFSFCHNCCYKALDGDVVLFILLYTAITAIQMLKSDSIDRKYKRTLLIFEEIWLSLQWLSSLCVNLGLLDVDTQAANAELKAEKSKQLSR